MKEVEGKADKPQEERSLPKKKPAPQKAGKPCGKGLEPEDLEGNFRVKRRRKGEACELRFSSSMLSEGLKRKFAHLCQQDGG